MARDELKRNYREDLDLFERPVSRALAVAFIVTVPLFALFGAGNYVVYLMTLVSLWVIAAVGLNLLIGYTGQISLGHAAFMAVGAYTHIIVYWKGTPLIVTVALGTLAAGLCGFLVGIPALRLKGPYLAIATLGFQVAVDQILGRWESVTGGRMGLQVPEASFFGVALTDPKAYFCVCFGVAVLVVLGVYNLTRSRVGRAFVAIRDNDTAAEAMGVGLVKYKTMAFALSAAITGLSGALFAHMVDVINPGTFSLINSIELLVMVLVGGLASMLGSILGAALIVLLPFGLSALSMSLDMPAIRDAQYILIGGILVAVLLFEPMGMRGRWLRVKYYFKAWPF